jgi:hypothetical protein
MNTATHTDSKRPLTTSDLAAATSRARPEEDLVDEPGNPQAPMESRKRQAAVEEPPATLESSRAAMESPCAAMDSPTASAPADAEAGVDTGGRLDPLFPADTAAEYRSRWIELQSGFVDDPRRAVAQGDELVAEVIQSLAESFALERQHLEDDLLHTGEASTEALRVGLRRYRSFFERLLSI